MSNTEQNYSGERANASPLEPTAQPQPPTAQKQAQPLSPADERRKAYYHRIADNLEAIENLESILDLLDSLAGSPDPAPLLADLTKVWLSQPQRDLNGDDKWTLREALTLIKTLADLRSYYGCFAAESLEERRHE